MKPVQYPHKTKQILTKRSLLSLVSRLFDPLGLLSPLTVRGKILIQEAWREKATWDEPLGPQYTQAWEVIQSELELAHKFKFKRDYEKNDNSD